MVLQFRNRRVPSSFASSTTACCKDEPGRATSLTCFSSLHLCSALFSGELGRASSISRFSTSTSAFAWFPVDGCWTSSGDFSSGFSDPIDDIDLSGPILLCEAFWLWFWPPSSGNPIKNMSANKLPTSTPDLRKKRTETNNKKWMQT